MFFFLSSNVFVIWFNLNFQVVSSNTQYQLTRRNIFDKIVLKSIMFHLSDSVVSKTWNGSMICIFHPILPFLRCWQHFSLFSILTLLMNKDYRCGWHQQIHHDHRLNWVGIDEVKRFLASSRKAFKQNSISKQLLSLLLLDPVPQKIVVILPFRNAAKCLRKFNCSLPQATRE